MEKLIIKKEDIEIELQEISISELVSSDRLKKIIGKRIEEILNTSIENGEFDSIIKKQIKYYISDKNTDYSMGDLISKTINEDDSVKKRIINILLGNVQ